MRAGRTENRTIGPRTGFFDDLVVAAVGDEPRQVVLGAGGMDTRPFRLPRSRLGIEVASSDYLTNPAVAPFLERLAACGISWRFGTNDPAAFLEAHGWRADVSEFDAAWGCFGRWPPAGVPEDVAARAAAASQSFFISARRAA